MISKKTVGIAAGLWAAASGITAHILSKNAEKTTYTAELMDPIEPRKMGFYEKHIKRVLDITCSSAAITVFSPLYLGVAALVKIKLGSPVLFTQDRPGLIGPDGKERIFKMYKFRSMTDEKDENGNLLPDEIRLTSFGKKLRATSLDELPEAFNILNGTMSVIGPRPQLVRDMVFMSDEQRIRHTAKPGLSGSAQINGRNNIDWNEKINWDLKYIERVSIFNDFMIVMKTVGKAFIKKEGITDGDMATAEDYGDYLLNELAVDKECYSQKQKKARSILNRENNSKAENQMVSIIMPSYNTARFIADAIQSVQRQTYNNWELIIVDDCSTDDTDFIVKPFLEDARIKYLKNENNSGAAISRNRAIKEASGKWIAFLDSDDMWLPDKLEKQIKFMNEKGYHFSYTKYVEIDEAGIWNGKIVSGPKKITKNGFFNYCWPGCLTVMYDADSVGLVQIHNIKKNNDYAMWLKICKKENCYLLDEILAKYRRGRTGSVSTNSIRTMIGWHYRLFHEAERQSALCSFANTGRNLIFGALKKVIYIKKQR